MDKAVELVAQAMQIVGYLAVKYQNTDADEACRLLALALKEMRSGGDGARSC